MSRSGYSDDVDGWELIRYRGAVRSAIRGKRGQAFLREMLAALDALPQKALISNFLKNEQGVCGLGAVFLARKLFDQAPPGLREIEGSDPEVVGYALGIATALAAEIAFINDEGVYAKTPEERFRRVRAWVVEQIKDSSDLEDKKTKWGIP